MTAHAEQVRDGRLETRIPAALKSVIQRAAELQGQTLTDFVLSSSTAAARQVIREHDMLEFSRRDQISFAKALLDPPKANARLEVAAGVYGKAGK
ncbi:MAG: DUF1778 domain-containing protein [Myxococcota bacterium]|jgi:uncharacterized protein (DUF1778 family)